MQENFEQIVEFTPAYDKRDPDPKKDYGIHGVNLRFVLKGPKGAVHFLLYTSWHLSHVREKLETCDRILSQPIPADVGYHSPVPMNEWQTEPTAANCDYLDGKSCYYDGSGLAADDAFNALTEHGDEGVWQYLRRYYQAIFNGGNE